MSPPDITIQDTKNGQHPPALQAAGAAYVTTAEVKRAAKAVEIAFARGGIVVFHGAPGLGKSMAASLAVQRIAAQFGVAVLWIQATSLFQRHKLTYLLANHFGLPIDQRALWKTADHIGQILKGKQLIIVIDEADRLSVETLGMLKDWHDLTNAEWALVLCGSHRLRPKLERTYPELLSRSRRCVHFTPLDRRPSIDFARQLHPLFAHAPIEVLREADRIYVHGNLRCWAYLLEDLLDIATDPTAAITGDHTRLAISQLALT